MNILLLILPILALIVKAYWPMFYQANIHFHQVVAPGYSQLYVMAEKYGIPRVHHPTPNIFASANYGYYELFICKSSQFDISYGCQQEIIDEVSFRYAHVQTLDFTFFMDKFLQREHYIVSGQNFDLCIIDATHAMRNIWLRGHYYYPSVYDRLQMPRKCWRISLMPMHLDDRTRAKMDKATHMKLVKFKNRRITYYNNRLNELQREIREYNQMYNELWHYQNRLEDEYMALERYNDELIEQQQQNLQNIAKLEQIAAEHKRIAEEHAEKLRKATEAKDKLEQLAKKDDDITKKKEESKHIVEDYKIKVEEEAMTEKGRIEKISSLHVKKTLIPPKEIQNDPDIKLPLLDEGTNKRRKRDTGDIIEKLKKIKPKKQNLLLNMAANEMLPAGTIDVDGLIEEVLTIRKESATPEEAKHLTLDSILNSGHEEWQKLAENEQMKEKINMIAVKKMQETVENTLLVDLEGDTDLEKIFYGQITNLQNSIKEAHENEKTMKKEGTYTEYRKKLLHEVKEIIEKTEKMEKEAMEKGKDLAENVQTHHNLLHTDHEPNKQGASEIEEVEEEVQEREKQPSESETDEEEHHHKDVNQHENPGILRTVLEKSRELLDWVKGNNARGHVVQGVTKLGAKSAEHLKTLGKIGGETIKKYGLDKRAKSAGEIVLDKAKNVGTAGKSLLHGAKDTTIGGMGKLVIGADLWKASSLSETYKAEHPDEHLEKHRRNMENLQKEHPQIYKKYFETE